MAEMAAEVGGESLSMRMYDIIMKKRNGGALSREEIQFFIQGYTAGEIPDYQASALMMAIYFQGMNEEETLELTLAMARSGDMLDLSGIRGIKVDKHSTGGVGDKTSLALTPMVAACGIPVAKMSGRGLGHTGGTIDKLESFPGFTTSLTEEQFLRNVNEIGIAIMGQTADLAPADKKLYALRDVTATVDNMSLIASSIMSKKLAAGANAIVLDVKTGSGAFMKKEEDALALAEEMVRIGRQAGRTTVAVVSDMDQPLGRAVGNALEVKEAIETLQGRGPEDFTELCMTLGSQMLLAGSRAQAGAGLSAPMEAQGEAGTDARSRAQAGAGLCASMEVQGEAGTDARSKAQAGAGLSDRTESQSGTLSEEEARQMLRKAIEDGSALRKLAQFVEAQGGDPAAVYHPELLPRASIIRPVPSPEEGYVAWIACDEVGMASLLLGGGRETKDSEIDLSVGLVLAAKTGDYVQKGQPLAWLHANDEKKAAEARDRFLGAYTFSQEAVPRAPLIKKIL